MNRTIWKLLLFLISSAPLLQAQSPEATPLVTDRPDFTESTETVAVGRYQLEFGYTFSKLPGEETHNFGELLVRTGITRALELRVGVNSFVKHHSHGQSLEGKDDASLGVKIRVWEPGTGNSPHLAIIMAASLPTGSRAFRQQNLQPEMKFGIFFPVSEGMAVSSNLNFARLYEDEGGFSQISGSLSFSSSLTQRISGYVEIFGFSPASKNGKTTRYVNGGFTFLVNPDLQADIRVGAGLNSVSPDYFAGFGAAVRI